MRVALLLVAVFFLCYTVQGLPQIRCNATACGDCGVSAVNGKCVCNVKSDDMCQLPDGTGGPARGGFNDRRRRWNNQKTPDGFWRVPYKLTAAVAAWPDAKSMIERAVSLFHAVTCVRFEPANRNDVDIIEFTEGQGCSSFIGRISNTQPITLARNCLVIGTVVHEMLHALGFFHEQSRSDRDDYVTINENNIIPDALNNFDKLPESLHISYGSAYDIVSVMHYSSMAFTRNNLPTIERKSGGGFPHQRITMSKGDQFQINAMYGCNGLRGVQETSSCYDKSDYGRSYVGTHSIGRSGVGCQPWADSIYSPDVVTGANLEGSFCRNPDSDLKGPWCWTKPDQNNGWEYCNVTVCTGAAITSSVPVHVVLNIALIQVMFVVHIGGLFN